MKHATKVSYSSALKTYGTATINQSTYIPIVALSQLC